MRRRNWLGMFLIVVIITSLLVISCAEPAPAPAPAPKPAPTVTVTAPAPTVTVTAPTPTPTPAPAFEPKLPSKMMWASLDIGTFGYTAAVGLGFALDKAYGMNVRILPVGTGVGRVQALNAGAGDIAFVSYEGWCAFTGSEEFSDISWGPQDVCALWCPIQDCGGAVAATSDIYTMADVKGKTVGFIPGYSAINKKVEGMLAFGGLTWDDVEIVEFPSSGSMYQAAAEGLLDFCGSPGPKTPLMREMEASPHGLRWIPLPFDDKEGWKRLQEVMPLVPSYLTQGGAGVAEGELIESYGYRYPQMLTYQGRISDETAYALMKALDESWEEYIKDDVPYGAMFQIEPCISPIYEVPLHTGTIRYAKDMGLWTAEHEAAQKAALEVGRKAREAWETVIEEALEKEIKAKDFPEYWLERRAELAGF